MKNAPRISLVARCAPLFLIALAPAAKAETDLESDPFCATLFSVIDSAKVKFATAIGTETGTGTWSTSIVMPGARDCDINSLGSEEKYYSCEFHRAKERSRVISVAEQLLGDVQGCLPKFRGLMRSKSPEGGFTIYWGGRTGPSVDVRVSRSRSSQEWYVVLDVNEHPNA